MKERLLKISSIIIIIMSTLQIVDLLTTNYLVYHYGPDVELNKHIFLVTHSSITGLIFIFIFKVIFIPWIFGISFYRFSVTESKFWNFYAVKIIFFLIFVQAIISIWNLLLSVLCEIFVL